MPLLGSAAILLSFDVDLETIEEHDRWHTHEHLPERLSIPGFHRGSRWTAIAGGPRYMVLYEVQNLHVLSSAAYQARLNNPTPWTTRMMPHYKGMRRGLCAVVGSFGQGQGGAAALIRFTPDESNRADLQRRLSEEVLAEVPHMSGLGSAHLLHGAETAAMTNEQHIRGADRGIDSAIIVTGYDCRAVNSYASNLAASELTRSANDTTLATYRLAYSLVNAERDIQDSGPARAIPPAR